MRGHEGRAVCFGFDPRTPDFWRASLDVARGDIARFEALVARRVGDGGR